MFDGIDDTQLKELAKYFPDDRPLYAVGGCVRDYLIGRKCYDVDLSGGVKPSELVKLLALSPFEVVSASPRLGTVIIKGKKKTYEYTTFRIDSYPSGSGVHTPADVRFTSELQVDAKRRDFKCNAIYCEVKSGKIIDPLGGKEDVANSVLSTTVDPQTVLSQDGLRIMRLVRFVSVLGYEVEEATYAAAKESVGRLNEISAERIRDELNKILAGEHCYKALRMMSDLGVLKTILPSLAENDGVRQKIQYHKYDVLEHTFRVVEAAPVEARLAALFHDIAKGVCQKKDGNMYFHNTLGAKMTREIMTKLKYPAKQIEATARVVQEHMFDVNGNTKESKCRRFIARNLDILDTLLALFRADCVGTGYLQSSRTAEKLERIYARMLDEGVPLSVKQLNINGKDLQEIGYKGKEIGEALAALWECALLGGVANDKEKLAEIAERKLENKNKFERKNKTNK